MLMEYPGNVRVRIDGIAASAATIIAMAGNTVEIFPVGFMFVHNPEAMSVGNSSDHRLTIEMLDEIKEGIINSYEIKTGLPRNELSTLMNEVHWMCAQKAVKLGFADKIMYWDEDGGSDMISNDVREMLQKIAGVVETLLNEQTKPMAQAATLPTAQIDNRVSADALMNRLNLIIH